MRVRAVLGAAVALCCAGAASATAAQAPNPAFRVTATSSYVRHHVTHLVRKRDANGCRFLNDVNTVDTITTSTEAPVRVQLSDLVRGGRDTFRLKVRQKRSGTYWYGWEPGCPLLAESPANRSDTSGCGTRRYDISNSKTGIGYAGGSNFRFTYSLNVPDPYDGRCLADFYRGDALGEVFALSMPPREWLRGKTKRRWWTTVARSRLLAGKPVVVRWKDSATINGQATLAPEEYEQTVYTDTYSLSWKVTLTPVT